MPNASGGGFFGCGLLANPGSGDGLAALHTYARG
jgi:hypothetical protein